MAPKEFDMLLRVSRKYLTVYGKVLQERYGQPLIELFELPVKVILSPITLAIDFVGSAPRGFGVPKLVSDLAFSSIFVVGTIGTYDVALEVGKKFLCQRHCKACNGWQALRCTMCRGTGEVHYQVKNYRLKRGEKATAESIADAVADNRAELVHLPFAVDISYPLPTKYCPSCDGSGVMNCPECKDRRLQVRLSADDIMEPPWKAYNVLQRMDFPYENIAQSMRDPKIANFWLLTMPQIVGGFKFDDDAKQKIWSAYKNSMQFDQLRDAVAKRKPGWEHLQNLLTSIDPDRAKEDPIIVKNVPYYKAKKTLEAEVMKLEVPPRPNNWGSQELDLPLDASCWTQEELKDPKKLLEVTSLLSAQKEIADKILDAHWEAKWRQDKLNELFQKKVQPYIQAADTGVLPQPIVIQSQEQEKFTELLDEKIPPFVQSIDTGLPQYLYVQCQEQEKKKRRWWFF